MMQNNNDIFIMVPSHKSYLDFILLAYVHYHFELNNPFVCGDEALFNMALTSYLIKSAGGFKLNSENMKSDMFKAVVNGYLYSLMKHD